MSRVEITIDSAVIEVPAGTTLWDAARSQGKLIPTLCHDPELRPVGVCRMCVVEVEGERTLTASCVRRAEPGMVVHTTNPKIERCRRVLTELLESDQPAVGKRLGCSKRHGEISVVAASCCGPSKKPSFAPVRIRIAIVAPANASFGSCGSSG